MVEILEPPQEAFEDEPPRSAAERILNAAGTQDIVPLQAHLELIRVFARCSDKTDRQFIVEAANGLAQGSRLPQPLVDQNWETAFSEIQNN